MKLFLCIFSCFIVSFQFLDADPTNPRLAIKNGVLDLGVKLQSMLAKKNVENKNVLFSPLNIYTALALLHLAANGTTRNQISKLMGIPQNQSPKTLHQTLKNVLEDALPKSENGSYNIIEAGDFKLANGIFVHEKRKLKKTFVNQTKFYYNSDIINVDFQKGDEAIDTINNYIANKTQNRIPKLYKAPVSPLTDIILASSLYLNSVWYHAFNESLTQKDEFHTDKGVIKVSMMNQKNDMHYAYLPQLGVEAIRLEFVDPETSMFIVLPEKNRSLRKFLSNLTSDHINTIVKQVTTGYIKVELKLPSTAFQWSKSIKEELGQLGLLSVVNDTTDLSNMIEMNDLQIDEIIHSTDIKIKEDGAEASAVTAIELEVKGDFEPDEPLKFYVNRPFFFFIYNRKIDTVFFYGTVYNPNG